MMLYLMAAVLLICPALAQTLELQHRFVEGRTWTYHWTAKGQGQTTLRGLPGDQTQELKANFTLQGDVTWTVGKVSQEGVADLVLRVPTLAVNGEVDGQALAWKLAPSPDSPPAEGLRLWVKPSGQVIEEKGRLPDGLQTLPPALQNIRLFLRHFALTPLPLPDRPVRAGEIWEQVHQVALPYLESAPTPLRFTYQWQDYKTLNGQRCACIQAAGEAIREGGMVPFAPWAERPTQTIDLTITRLQQTFSERAYFAPKAGRTERRQWEMDFKLAATAAVPTPSGGEQEVGVAVTWQVSGTLMRRNTL